jgi:hypothetical protein
VKGERDEPMRIYIYIQDTYVKHILDQRLCLGKNDEVPFPFACAYKLATLTYSISRKRLRKLTKD